MKKTIAAGERHHMLTAVRFVEYRGKSPMWVWRCDCGVEKLIDIYNVRRGHAHSCGCYAKERIRKASTIHGLRPRGPTKHRALAAIAAAIKRCENPNDASYSRYGGRGISVCERWRNSPAAFVEDMGMPPPRYSLDRINNDGNYEPGNCRWATPRTQNNNRQNTVYFRGNPISFWAEKEKLPIDMLRHRVQAGWPDDRVLLPVGSRRK